MNQPLISVIVPIYNVERYFVTGVDSVLNQTYNNWELILIDDGSPDHCPAMCDEYAAQDKRIKVIHKKNGGTSSARNAGLDIAKGDYVSFLDGDDFWHKDYLKIMVNLGLKYRADIVQCGFIRGTEKAFPQIPLKYKIKVFNNHSVFLKGYAKIIVWSKLYKRQLFNEVRMPEGKFFEDDFTTWKWYYNAKQIVVTHLPLYYYTKNIVSTMSVHSKKPRFDFLEAYDERITFFIKNGEKDLEDVSRAHLCKSMLLMSSNPLLSKEQKKIVNVTFLKNWQNIKYSKNVPFRLKILFIMFRLIPKMTLNLLNVIR